MKLSINRLHSQYSVYLFCCIHLCKAIKNISNSVHFFRTRIENNCIGTKENKVEGYPTKKTVNNRPERTLQACARYTIQFHTQTNHFPLAANPVKNRVHSSLFSPFPSRTYLTRTLKKNLQDSWALLSSLFQHERSRSHCTPTLRRLYTHGPQPTGESPLRFDVRRVHSELITTAAHPFSNFNGVFIYGAPRIHLCRRASHSRRDKGKQSVYSEYIPLYLKNSRICIFIIGD